MIEAVHVPGEQVGNEWCGLRTGCMAVKWMLKHWGNEVRGTAVGTSARKTWRDCNRCRWLSLEISVLKVMQAQQYFALIIDLKEGCSEYDFRTQCSDF